ncbi:hypothetical protein GRI39_09475 [Altererythrobacter indicus]|uniref:Lipoprotein n=1 Tax=Altericroceibacterium indicum TaxID=374177 RepID=A0A845A989_9SPHN|nr:hypothetical protein [Altericroceibacterium indicum]MXP26264.1 hypothetical protein [Altericroceibacterium indicum]
MWRRLALVMALGGSLSACAGGPRVGGSYERVANPSNVLATDLALARLAREKGQLDALSKYATSGAIVLSSMGGTAFPASGKAADNAKADSWVPQSVWASCDGSLVVTYGAITKADGASGEYATVWQRQSKGDFKWAVHLENLKSTAPLAPDFIQAKVADCAKRDRPGPFQRESGKSAMALVNQLTATGGEGVSHDRTLSYRWRHTGDDTKFSVTMKRNGQDEDVLTMQAQGGR